MTVDGAARTMSFGSLYRHGMARVAACTTPCTIAAPMANAAAVLDSVRECDEQAVAVALFPELALSGYAIDDLFLQDCLLDAVEKAVAHLVEQSRDLMPLILVGAPLRHAGRVYNTAVAVHRGRLLGVVPKVHLPNYREFYERRHFASGAGTEGGTIRIGAQVGAHEAPFGPDLLFQADDIDGLVVHAEVCEDLWVAVPPSSQAALAGATVLANLSASNITIGKAETRRLLCQSQSARCIAAYLYSSAGAGESTTDLAWDGQASIFENGETLVETERFPKGAQMAVADVDLDVLRQERLRMGTFDDNRRLHGPAFRRVAFRVDPPGGDIGLRRNVPRFPFVPAARERLELDCYEAYNIQVAGLVQRLRATGMPRIVIGVSGGLDSTHALIVAARAMDLLDRPRTDILAFTMPGFGTSDKTKGNALRLMSALGVSHHELDIRPAANQMLKDMDHPFARGEAVYDVTFENVQAGLRTDYLFRLANQRGGIVLGTGDLSELALGWCTYGVGDQMAHYNVNSGVPKSLIQHLIRWVIGSRQFPDEVLGTLGDILATEISPELVPAGSDRALQSSEAVVGPYELQDFHLFHTLRYGLRPSKIAFLALHAWSDPARGDWPAGYPAEKRSAYTLAEIHSWLRVFIQRFFGFSQFKRSAMPNGPKVTAGGSLSPRGDWRAPSDGNARIWLEELEREVPKE
ncbi:NAD+ synthase (glutamine-hydrolysing) [Azospirillum brasilense]|uniref:Glutamine-dependent NAD(+) synthetase n=2 Tax=Azospirillum brasilense TaxID=192 RepID=A0A560ASS5_AZOBR|nr:NAD+ synthase (glutamine-hydrolysing) [Azospirillum brasilense]